MLGTITRGEVSVKKIDAIFLSIFFTAFFWWLFRYNWAYCLVTCPSFFYLHKYLFDNFRKYRYVITGLSSVIWGLFGLALGYGVRGLILHCGVEPGYHIVVLISLFHFIISFYAHYREHTGWKDKSEINFQSLSSKLKSNKIVLITLISSSVLYLIFIVTTIGLTTKEIDPDNWEYFSKENVEKRRDQELRERKGWNVEVVDNGAKIHELPDKKSKIIGHLKTGFEADSILNWTFQRNSRRDGFYFVSFEKIPEWCVIFNGNEKMKGGWFKWDEPVKLQWKKNPLLED
ncbi:MAG: hypothetical protein V4561_10115 [Bacteroidota bacterium]